MRRRTGRSGLHYASDQIETGLLAVAGVSETPSARETARGLPRGLPGLAASGKGREREYNHYQDSGHRSVSRCLQPASLLPRIRKTWQPRQAAARSPGR